MCCRRAARRGCSWCRGAWRSSERTFRRTRHRVEMLNAFRTPAQRRLIFEEFFLYQIGHAWRRHAASAELKPFVADGRRSDPRVGRRGPAVQADAGAAAGDQGDRRRHAAAAADAPAAAGRRRRRQDDRGAARGDRGDGERPAGGVHGADRDPGRAALRQHRAAAVAVALPRRPADRQHARPAEAHAAGAHRARHDAIWSSARTRSCRRRSSSTSWAWSSSTSSIASAWRSARRCGRRGCGPTCC